MTSELFSFCDSNSVPKIKNVYKTVGLSLAIVTLLPSTLTTNDAIYTYNNTTGGMQVIESIGMDTKICESEGVLKMSIDARKYENLRLLNTISALEEDWNGYGAAVFSKESLAFFESLINGLDIQPIISPTGRGTLYLEYSDGVGMLGFEAFDGKIDMAFISDDGRSRNTTIDKNFNEEINKMVEKYYGERLH